MYTAGVAVNTQTIRLETRVRASSATSSEASLAARLAIRTIDMAPEDALPATDITRSRLSKRRYCSAAAVALLLYRVRGRRRKMASNSAWTINTNVG